MPEHTSPIPARRHAAPMLRQFALLLLLVIAAADGTMNGAYFDQVIHALRMSLDQVDVQLATNFWSSVVQCIEVEGPRPEGYGQVSN